MLVKTRGVLRDLKRFYIAINVEVKDIVQWIACQRRQMDVVEVQIEESCATDVVDLGYEARDRRSVLCSQPALQSGSSGAKPPVQVYQMGCVDQLPEEPQELTGNGQVFELKSGGTIKLIHASARKILNSNDILPWKGKLEK